MLRDENIEMNHIKQSVGVGRTKELGCMHPQHKVKNICSNRIALSENEQGQSLREFSVYSMSHDWE